MAYSMFHSNDLVNEVFGSFGAFIYPAHNADGYWLRLSFCDDVNKDWRYWIPYRILIEQGTTMFEFLSIKDSMVLFCEGGVCL